MAGRLMTFADYCLLRSRVICREWSFSGEFLDVAREDELIEAAAEITRAGDSLIFVRGDLTLAERLLFTFSRHDEIGEAAGAPGRSARGVVKGELRGDWPSNP